MPDINSNLVGWWTFDEGSGTVLDSSGNGNTGTMTAGATWTSSARIGPFAASLDGVDDFVDITNETNFDFERTTAFSAFGWINATNSGGADATFFGKNGPGTQFTGWHLYTTSASNLLTVEIVANRGTAIFIRKRVPGVTVTDGIWRHVGFTYSGNSLASGVEIYINGVRRTDAVMLNDTLGSNSILNNNNFAIGKLVDDGANMAGFIDDVRVYRRVLSEADVRALYNYPSMLDNFVSSSTVGMARKVEIVGY